MVLIALAENADTESGICYPSNQLLAWRTRQTGRNVRNCIRELVDAGWVALVPGAGDRGTNVYRLDVRRLAQTAADRRKELREIRMARRQQAIAGLGKAVETAQENLFAEDGGRKTFPGGAETAGSAGGGNSSFRRTVSEPSVEPSEEKQKHSPLPPSQAMGVKEISPLERALANPHLQRLSWDRFKRSLKEQLCDAPNLAKFRPLVDGEEDYDTAFRDWWLEDFGQVDGRLEVRTLAAEPRQTLNGLAKYRSRIEALLSSCFDVPAFITLVASEPQPP